MLGLLYFACFPTHCSEFKCHFDAQTAFSYRMTSNAKTDLVSYKVPP
jgi:hypothetical protein